MTPVAASPPQDGLAAFEEAWDGFFDALRNARARAAREPHEGLSLAQFHLIAPLARRDQAPVGELAALAGVAAPTATRTLDGLAREGVVDREHSAADRRCVVVRLTPEGRKLLEKKMRLVERKRRAVYEELPPEQRAAAAAVLASLADAFEEL